MRHEQSFDTWGAYVEACTKSATGASRNHRGGYEWDFGASFDASVALAERGWPEGMTRVRPLEAALTAKLASHMERVEWHPDTTGHVLDVAAYVSGEPEHWYVPTYTVSPSAGQAVRIVFNAATSAAISAEVMAARGAALCALIQAFGVAGRPVRVEACIAIRGGDRTHHAETRICVKDFDAALDMDRLVFALAHPAMLRRLWFGAAEGWPEPARRAFSIGQIYGWPAEVTDKGDVYVGEAMLGEPQWTNARDALTWVERTLRKQGVALRDHGGAA